MKSYHFSAVHPLRASIPRLSRSAYSSTASFLSVADMENFVVSFESAASCLKFDERGGKVRKLGGAGLRVEEAKEVVDERAEYGSCFAV